MALYATKNVKYCPSLVENSKINTQAKDNVATALQDTLHQLEQLQEKYGREPGSVALLAVSKTKPVTAIREAMAVGQRDFGENYVDEAVAKIDELRKESSSCCWHYIGQIQSNKTRLIANYFDWVHGIDRAKIATRLSQQRDAGLPPLNCCIQLNLDREASKAGVQPHELPELCRHFSGLANLRLRGLMCIPAPRTELEEQRELFRQVASELHTLQAEFPDLDTLSMGMSADIEAAVAEGSTMVRVGTAIFGART